MGTASELLSLLTPFILFGVMAIWRKLDRICDRLQKLEGRVTRLESVEVFATHRKGKGA